MSNSLQIFFAEAREQLLLLEQTVLALDGNAEPQDSLETLFRAAHTIKGSASLFDFRAIEQSAHQLESMLDTLRQQPSSIQPEAQARLLAHIDQLHALLHDGESAPTAESHRSTPESAWHIVIRFGAETMQEGIDPAHVLQFLAGMGELCAVHSDFSALPGPDQFDPQCCYLELTVTLAGALDAEQVQASLSLCGSSTRVAILPPQLSQAEARAQAQQLSDQPEQVLARWQQQGLLASREPAAATVIRPTPSQHRSMRIDADRLDNLIDLVGELLQAGAVVSMQVEEHGSEPLHAAQQTVGKLLLQLRDHALALRMVPVSDLFDRLPRLVRETAQSLGKTVQLDIQGSDTELDRQMVEQLVDPLTHLIRNALDHGLETPEARLAAGKPATGLLRVAARHAAGRVVIDVSDDGRGLDYPAILAQAKQRGLLDGEAHPDQAQLARLILQPGFSTSAEVNVLSGRGVGLDVVKRNIDSLRGQLDIHSEPGQGCLFTLHVPLTLAIINAFRVRLGESEFILPLDQVSECFGLRDPQLAQRQHLERHGEMLPLLHLDRLFGLPPSSSARRDVAVISAGPLRAGLVVDELGGEMQAVIKPLGELLQPLPWFSGSTVLPNGRIGLLLDVARLIGLACLREDQHLHAASHTTPSANNEVYDGKP